MTDVMGKRAQIKLVRITIRPLFERGMSKAERDDVVKRVRSLVPELAEVAASPNTSIRVNRIGKGSARIVLRHCDQGWRTNLVFTLGDYLTREAPGFLYEIESTVK